MSSITVHRVDTTRRADVKRFVRWPFSLYRGCDLWIPPLWRSARGELDRERHPFYAHSTAEFYLAEHNGAVVGRLAVLDNARYNHYRGTRTAGFSLFEAVDEQAVADALFDAARQWARDRGLGDMVGPRGLIGSDSGGILVEGFDEPPAIGVPYNHAYYDRLLTGVGLQKDTDHLSGCLPGTTTLPARFQRIIRWVESRGRFRIVTPRTGREMRAWVPRVIEAHRRSFADRLTYVPPTEAEIGAIVGTLLGVTLPGLVQLALEGDEVVGFILAYPDISVGMRRARGRLWPLGWAHILRARHTATRVCVNGGGVVPSHQGLGINTLLYAALLKHIKARGYARIELVEADERNRESIGDNVAAGVRWTKRHRNYVMAL